MDTSVTHIAGPQQARTRQPLLVPIPGPALNPAPDTAPSKGEPALGAGRKPLQSLAPAPAKTPPAKFSLDNFDEDDRLGGRRTADNSATGVAGRGANQPAYPMADADMDRWQRHRSDDVPEMEIGFADFLDVINPLQHIPLVSSLYRAITGDEISPPAQILGGALFGGPVGFVGSIASVIAEEASGQSVGEIALAALIGGDEIPEIPVAVAAAQTAPQEQIVAAIDTSAPSIQDRAIIEKGGGDRPRSLTGRDALNAFARDLRGEQTAMPAGVAATNPAAVQIVPVETVPLANATQASAVTRARPGAVDADPAAFASNAFIPASLTGAQQSQANVLGANALDINAASPNSPDLNSPGPSDAFAARMLNALDKYRALGIENGQTQPPQGQRINSSF